MSCNAKLKLVDGSLVDKILEQGQKLRNAMIGSILSNDPLFNTDILQNKHYNTPELSYININSDNERKSCIVDEKRLEAFIKGECLTKEDEKLALDTLRSLSASDLYKTTERSLKSTKNVSNCKCNTCELYNRNYPKMSETKASKQDFSPSKQTSPKSSYSVLTSEIQSRYTEENRQYLSYVDSLRITVSSLTLNEAGHQKLSQYLNIDPLHCTITFFLEYNTSELGKKTKKSKVDSGLTANNIRICCRKTEDSINFKHVMVHDLEKISDCQLEFKISCRVTSQKKSCDLGYAIFNFNEFLSSKNLTCCRGLTVLLNKKSPISVGVLKVTLQLGCGRLFFGQEFIDAIRLSQRKNIALDNDDKDIMQSIDEAHKLTSTKDITKDILMSKQDKIDNRNNNNKALATLPGDIENVQSNSRNLIRQNVTSSYFGNKPIQQTEIPEKESILFGFLYISEAQYFSEPFKTYLSCRPFCQNEISISRIETDTANPQFHFQQIIPLVLNNDLLYQFRENTTAVEFWKKSETTDEIFGFTKVSLHQFYLAYRNFVISKYLANNKLPVISVDWWEPIYSTDELQIVGQVQLLVALGTEQQIFNLKSERGFLQEIVKAKPRENKKIISDRSQKVGFSSQKKPLKNENKKTSVDVSTQSDILVNMEKDTKEKTADKSADETKEILGSLLNQLMNQRPRNVFVENSTNTEGNDIVENGNLGAAQSKTNVQLRKTTDLLDSLQKALTTDQQPKSGCFKASVAINSANHLPVRKKCRSKKSRNSHVKHEDKILPSCYVSFETSPRASIKTTHVVPKSTNPVWNFKCEVELPLDLLENNQKRLIFKVWRKSNNTVTLPNSQADMVLGLAALDLTVLLAGLPNVQGWFNIIDFNGKCNGQLNVHVTPLENISKYRTKIKTCEPEKQEPDSIDVQSEIPLIDQSETLSRALKRKFVELDEITQRLRLRLSKVTYDESDNSSDGLADEFEKDINTLCIEEDFDLINFEENSQKSKENGLGLSLLKTDYVLTDDNNESSGSGTKLCKIEDDKNKSSSSMTSSSNSFDKHLITGKQQIASLLEKLTLLSAGSSNDPFQSRYVSGCSVVTEPTAIDTEAILQQLDHTSRPNIQCSIPFNRQEFDEIYVSSEEEMKNTAANISSEDTSLISDASVCRIGPEGQGRNVEDSSK